jgi:hypothetical protein
MAKCRECKVPSDPNQLTIFIRCARIRRKWSAREKVKRSRWATARWAIPLATEADLFSTPPDES